jgi:hypothetical protein
MNDTVIPGSLIATDVKPTNGDNWFQLGTLKEIITPITGQGPNASYLQASIIIDGDVGGAILRFDEPASNLQQMVDKLNQQLPEIGIFSAYGADAVLLETGSPRITGLILLSYIME